MGTVTQLPSLKSLQAEIYDVLNRAEEARGGVHCQEEQIEVLKALLGHLLALIVDRRILSTYDVKLLIDGVPKLTEAAWLSGPRLLTDVEHYASDLKLADKGLVSERPTALSERWRELEEAAEAAWPR